MPSTPLSVAMLQVKFCGGGASRQLVDFAVGGVGYVKCLVRSDREIVAGIVVARQIPADLRRAGSEIKASQCGMPLSWRSVGHRRQLTCPQCMGGGVRQHAEEKCPGAF